MGRVRVRSFGFVQDKRVCTTPALRFVKEPLFEILIARAI